MQTQILLTRPLKGHPKLAASPSKLQRWQRTQAALVDQPAASEPSRDPSGTTAAQPLTTREPDAAAQGIEEYAQLKQLLFKRAQRAGGFLSAYLLLQQGSVAAVCSGLGTAVGYLYLKALVAAVDRYNADTVVPLDLAREYQGPFKAVVLGFAAYRQALAPRLLLPCGLAAAVGAFNTFSGYHLSELQEFEVLLGFLSYKAGLWLALYDDMKPKFDPEAAAKAPRPVLPQLPMLEGEQEAAEQKQRDRQRH